MQISMPTTPTCSVTKTSRQLTLRPNLLLAANSCSNSVLESLASCANTTRLAVSPYPIRLNRNLTQVNSQRLHISNNKKQTLN